MTKITRIILVKTKLHLRPQKILIQHQNYSSNYGQENFFY